MYYGVQVSGQSFINWFNRRPLVTGEEWPSRVLDEFRVLFGPPSAETVMARLNFLDRLARAPQSAQETLHRVEVEEERTNSAVSSDEEESAVISDEEESDGEERVVSSAGEEEEEGEEGDSITGVIESDEGEATDIPARHASATDRVLRYFAVMRHVLARFRAGREPRRDVLSTPDAVSRKRKAEEEPTRSATEERYEADDEEIRSKRRRKGGTSSPPASTTSLTSNTTARLTTDIEVPYWHPFAVLPTREAGGTYHVPGSSNVMRYLPARRAGKQPLRKVLGAPYDGLFERRQAHQKMQREEVEGASSDEEESKSNEEDAASSAEDEDSDSDAEVEEQVTSSARSPVPSIAQLKQELERLQQDLRRHRASIIPLPPSPTPSTPSSPRPSSPTSFTTSSTTAPYTYSTSSNFSTTTPAKSPLDEVVLRHILTNIDTFHKHPAEEMIRSAIDSLMARGEYRLVHDLLDDALRAGNRPIDDVGSEEEEERESVGGEESSVSEDGDAENDKEASESDEEAADEVPDNVCVPAEKNANTRKTRLAAVGALPSGWNASLLIRPRFFAGKAPAGNRDGNAVNGVGQRGRR